MVRTQMFPETDRREVMTPDQIEQMRKAFRDGARGLNQVNARLLRPKPNALAELGQSIRAISDMLGAGFSSPVFRRAADTAYIKGVATRERRIASASLAATVKRVRDEMGLASDG